MLQEFLIFYLNKAKYELIDEGKVYYGEISELKGVWATGKTLEECRKNLLETLEGWVILRLKKNLTLTIPNPHPKDISPDLLSRIFQSNFLFLKSIWNLIKKG